VLDHPHRFRELVADDLPRQGGIERLATALLPDVAGDFDLFHFLRHRGACRRQGLGLVQEQLLLVAAAGFRLGVEQLAQVGSELLLEQIPLNGDRLQQLAERVSLGDERVIFFGAEGDRRHA
jgi:hypothetical protein